MSNKPCWESATHRLNCCHAIARNRRYFTMRCNILKEMPDGKRYKILLFGRLWWPKCRENQSIRYVDKDRVKGQCDLCKIKGEG